MHDYLRTLAGAHARGRHAGIYSVCSAHPWVLEAAMSDAKQSAIPLLIEATCNQVNQFGGYTGMTPARFREFVESIAHRAGFPAERLILGGDHLGPHPWQGLSRQQAMAHAADMVRTYVDSGFHKIHLDTSMPCADDPFPLPDEVIASRAAWLAAAAEETAGSSRAPVYVIGTEVPTPGGAGEETELAVTTLESAERALECHHQAFLSAGLERAWERVIALVVQPGVEFNNDHVVDYIPAKAAHLGQFLERHPLMVFEAHSTDYQLPGAYRALVHDGFSILKVGPQLTFAMRQGIDALARIEDELVSPHRASRIRAVLEYVMLESPQSWLGHYHGSYAQQKFSRTHSYSDRIRYYWHLPEVQSALATLLENLSSIEIPQSILCDVMPNQYRKVRAGALASTPVALILDGISTVLETYRAACA